MNQYDKIAESAELNSFVEGFINSYNNRDKNIDFSSWLTAKLQEEMPDMSADSSRTLSEEIVEGVAEYDRTLNDLNEAVEMGQSKEEWLAGRVAEAYADMPFNEAGGILQQVDNDFNAANTSLMREFEDASEPQVTVVEAEIVDWNEYSVKNKAFSIAQQAAMSGLGTAADIIKMSMESGETVDADYVIGQALEIGTEVATCEIKAVVAGAIKTATEKGLTDILPADTPVDTICDIAGVAVENAAALFDVAAGKTTMAEALEKAGRASVAAACHWCVTALKVKLALIPVVGPLISILAGNLLEKMKNPKFLESTYTAVRNVACSTWGRIKQAGQSIFNKLKNTATNLQNN